MATVFVAATDRIFTRSQRPHCHATASLPQLETALKTAVYFAVIDSISSQLFIAARDRIFTAARDRIFIAATDRISSQPETGFHRSQRPDFIVARDRISSQPEIAV
jgi:hypothetical protein